MEDLRLMPEWAEYEAELQKLRHCLDDMDCYGKSMIIELSEVVRLPKGKEANRYDEIIFHLKKCKKCRARLAAIRPRSPLLQ